MEGKEAEAVRDVVLSAFEVSLESQLRAIRKLRREGLYPKKRPSRGRSQQSMAYDILRESGAPLHVEEIISRIAQRFGVQIDRESLVSSLSKKVVRGDRFFRAGRNTFGLLEWEVHE
jgi:transposase